MLGVCACVCASFAVAFIATKSSSAPKGRSETVPSAAVRTGPPSLCASVADLRLGRQEAALRGMLNRARGTDQFGVTDARVTAGLRMIEDVRTQVHATCTGAGVWLIPNAPIG